MSSTRLSTLVVCILLLLTTACSQDKTKSAQSIDGNFYSTSHQFYQAHPNVIKVFLEELKKSEIWTKDHPKEVAQLLAPVTQLDPPTLEKMHDKYDYGLVPITEKLKLFFHQME